MTKKFAFMPSQNGQLGWQCIEYDRRLHICLYKIEVKGFIFRNTLKVENACIYIKLTMFCMYLY
jgi:hypothetical protein